MSEQSAKGVQGCLLYNPFTYRHFFRIYKEDKSFEDFEVCAEDIDVMILGDGISLYRGKTRGLLDWSSKVLGHTRNPGDPAARSVIKDGKLARDENGKCIIEHGTYGEDLEFIPNKK